MIITFGFLVLYTAIQPYCTSGLSKTQTCTLISQFISLFSASCLVVTSYVQKDLISAGEADATSQTAELFGGLIIGANLLVAVLPAIIVLMSAEFAEKWDIGLKQVRAFMKKDNQSASDSNGAETLNLDSPSNGGDSGEQFQESNSSKMKIFSDFVFTNVQDGPEEMESAPHISDGTGGTLNAASTQHTTLDSWKDKVESPHDDDASDFQICATLSNVQISAEAPVISSLENN